MPGIISNQLGKITIHEDIIALIAGYATIENAGIIGMASKNATDGLWVVLRRDNLRKGVRVAFEDESIIIDLYVMVEYGVSINAVAENIIHNVGYKVKEFTGLQPASVNVHVEGVRVQ